MTFISSSSSDDEKMGTGLAEIGEDEEFVLLIMEQEDKTFMKNSMSLLEELRNCEENGYLL